MLKIAVRLRKCLSVQRKSQAQRKNAEDSCRDNDVPVSLGDYQGSGRHPGVRRGGLRSVISLMF